MRLTEFLATDNYIIVNKELIKILGLEETILLGELASEYEYWLRKNELINNEWFYSTVENVEQQTTLNDYKQRKLLNKLQALNILQVEVRGIPPKRYVKLNIELLENQFLNNLIHNSQNFKELNLKNFQTNNNKINNNKNNKENIIKESELIEKIIKYLNDKLHTNYRKDTKETVRVIKSDNKLEKYSYEDFVTVIDKKYNEWHGTEQEKYLRPSTLFGSKFEQYLNQKDKSNTRKKIYL